MKLDLNNNQALRAGICLANMLGLYVKDEEIFNNGIKVAYPLYCHDKIIGEIRIRPDMDDVGKRVELEAKNKEFKLIAAYKIPSAQGMEDAESGISGIVCADWQYKIYYKVITKNNLQIRDNLTLSCSADLEFGTKCTIHSNMSVRNSKLGRYFNLEFNNSGYNFKYSNENKQFEENIEISFLQDRIGHTICSDFDEKGKWHARKIAGAGTAYYNGTKRLRWYRKAQKLINDNIEDIHVLEDNHDLMGSYGDVIQSIQLGKAAQLVAPDMFKRIQQIRECLKINDTYLFDYLVDAMFSNKELTKATFGYIPENISYQNGETSLKDAYFGDFNQNNNLLNK